MRAYLKILRPDEALMMAMPVIIIAIVGLDFTLSVVLGTLVVFLMAGAGNVINDVFDYKIDAVNKPDRPIPSGRISLKNARIYAWIRKYAGSERIRRSKPVSVTELDKKKLAEILETRHFQNGDFELTDEKRITSREVPVFTSILKSGYPKADLVIKENGFVTIVETKKEGAGIQDLYQLKMYCDGYRMDKGKGPDSAILVADSFPESLERFRKALIRTILAALP